MALPQVIYVLLISCKISMGSPDLVVRPIAKLSNACLSTWLLDQDLSLQTCACTPQFPKNILTYSTHIILFATRFSL